MKQKIDFSKAPAWATHVMTTGEKWSGSKSINGSIEFAIKRGDEYFTRENGGSRYHLGETSWRVIQEIPKAWNGEGLPPVGTVCEFFNKRVDPEDPWHHRLNDVHKVEIIAHFENYGGTVAAFKFETVDAGWHVEHAVAYCFRPIQTPEQIEAKNREDFVKKAASLFFDASGGVADDPAFNALYNAGCRFQ